MIHPSLSQVIKLSRRHPRNKERKKEPTNTYVTKKVTRRQFSNVFSYKMAGSHGNPGSDTIPQYWFNKTQQHTGRFRATLLVRTILMRSQQFGGVSGVAAHTNEQTNKTADDSLVLLHTHRRVLNPVFGCMYSVWVYQYKKIWWWNQSDWKKNEIQLK